MGTNHFDTLSQATTALQKQGYTEDLNLKSNCVECRALGYEMLADDFTVDEVHRFEGDSNPADASVLYAISSEKYDLKGLLIDAYGAYADPLTTEMIQKLKYEPN
ncbi:MAG: phosphoribosylpyrophosphate synthetase [Bacteroidota bacterium]